MNPNQEQSQARKPKAELLKVVEADGMRAELYAELKFEDTAAALGAGEFTRFKGRQLRVENPVEGFRFQGQIEAVHVTGKGPRKSLTVEMQWLAEYTAPGRWQAVPAKPYQVTLCVFAVQAKEEARLVIYNPYNYEVASFLGDPQSHIKPPR